MSQNQHLFGLCSHNTPNSKFYDCDFILMVKKIIFSILGCISSYSVTFILLHLHKTEDVALCLLAVSRDEKGQNYLQQ